MGEDGIIDWLIERAQIPPHLHSFVEFGIESYLESNTRCLLENRNWRSFVMNGDQRQIDLRRETSNCSFVATSPPNQLSLPGTTSMTCSPRPASAARSGC